MGKNTRKILFFVGVVVLGLVLPLLVRSSYWRHVLILAYFYGLLACSWSFLEGYGGQFSFGHIALATVGGYTSGLLGKYFGFSPPISMLVGVLGAGLIGFVIGVLCLRFRGAYLALFTIAFSEIVRVVITAESNITMGRMGLELSPLFAEANKIPYYYNMFLFLVFGFAIMYLVVHSRYGLYLRSIREDQDAAEAMGVDITKYKVLAFTLTSMICGVAGVFYGHYLGILTPSFTSISTMGLVIAMAIIGGVESLVAAALGGILLEFGLEFLREVGTWRLVLFGGLLVFVVRFARNGLIAPVYHKVIGE